MQTSENVEPSEGKTRVFKGLFSEARMEGAADKIQHLYPHN